MISSFKYSLLKRIVFRVSIVGILSIIVSGVIISIGFIQDIKGHLNEDVFDLFIDEYLMETIEHVYWVFGLMLLVLLIFVFFTVRSSLNDVNLVSDKIKNLNINNTDFLQEKLNAPVEIKPLVQSIEKLLKKAQEDVKQQKEFNDHISHELNTPLAILRANIEGLKEGQEKKDLIKDLNLIEDITSQLLRLSQIEHFKVTDKEFVDLNEIIEEVITSMDRVELSQRIKLEILKKDTYFINGNREYIFMCFRNLIDNAIKNSPKDSLIQITINKSNNVTIKNEKLNKNLNQSHASEIFHKFKRIDKKLYEGSGLGLAVVKRIVEAHNANIAVQIDDRFFSVTIKFKNKIATN